MVVKATIDHPERTGRDGAVDHFLHRQEVQGEPLARLLYASSNGDAWYLVRDSEGIAIIHVPNEASGGRVERIAVAHFLSAGRGPEHQELMRLIGTLVDNQ